MTFVGDLLSALGLGNFPVTQNYGSNAAKPGQPSPYGYDARGHLGKDIGAPLGTPLKMPFTGSLIAGNEPGGFGNYLKAVRSDGLTVTLGHLSEFVGIRPGQTLNVQAGSVIGKTGDTGNASGPHAHVQVEEGGGPVNPDTLKGSLTPSRSTPVPLFNPVGVPGFTVPTFGVKVNPQTGQTSVTTEPFTQTGEVAREKVDAALPDWLAAVTGSDGYVNTVGFIVGLSLAGLGVLLLAASFINVELPAAPTVTVMGGKANRKNFNLGPKAKKKGAA